MAIDQKLKRHFQVLTYQQNCATNLRKRIAGYLAAFKGGEAISRSMQVLHLQVSYKFYTNN